MQENDSLSMREDEREVKIQEEAVSDPNNSGRWTDQENLKYIMFLSKNKQKFSCKLKRRKIRLFQEMAEFIGSRSSVQCRTHHQKYELKFKDTKNIINIYKEEIGRENYRKITKNFNNNGSIDKSLISSSFNPDAFQQSTPAQQHNLNSVAVQTDPVDSLQNVSSIIPLKPIFPTTSNLWFPYYY